MNAKMSKLLDTQLIEAHLRLDPDQIASRKMYALFGKVLNNDKIKWLTVGSFFHTCKARPAY